MPDPLTIHQLLGRIAYFHVLFIEPALVSALANDRECCGHGNPETDLAPWTVLFEIASSLGLPETCPSTIPGCCPVCRVRSAVTHLAASWISTEQRAYGFQHETAQAQSVATAAGAAIAHVFAATRCLPCSRLTPPRKPPVPLALPLIDELLVQWTAPGSAPVVSALNHCAGLADVARLVKENRQ